MSEVAAIIAGAVRARRDTSNLGKAVIRPPYVSNVWDMLVVGDRIYLGAGNSSNIGPESHGSAGVLMYYDATLRAFVSTGFTPTEEQIESFRVIDGEPVLPGHDKTANGNTKYYKLQSGVWVTYRVGGSNFHTYDVYKFGSLLFAGIGYAAATPWNTIRKSVDNGTTWSEAQTSASPATYRGYRFFEFLGVLYASCYTQVLCWDGTVFGTAGAPTAAQMFPGITNPEYTRVERVVNVGSSIVYIAARNINDHQFDGVALYTATDLMSPTKVTLGINEVPWDILPRGSTVYVLTSRLISSGPQVFEIRVIKSTDLAVWTEVLAFEQPTFARSFEELGGYFYFGLGTGTGLSDSYTDAIKAESGTILRYRA